MGCKMAEAVGVQKAGRFADACLAWDAARNDGGDPAVCLGERAYCEFRADRPADCLKTCDALAMVDPKSSRAFYMRGLVAKSGGDSATAREQFRLAMFHGDSRAGRQLALLGRPSGR